MPSGPCPRWLQPAAPGSRSSPGTTGEKAQLIATDAAATGLADVVGIDTPKLYVAEADRKVAIISIDDTSSGTVTAPAMLSTFAMPGPVSKVAFDAATKMVHVLGRTPDGSAETVYVVVEPHTGRHATYADALLPLTSVAWAIDATHDYPSTDREALLVASADGTIASVDVGGDPFAWRFPGVIAGALTALLLYLLARILFKRRSIAVLVGVLVAVDGMFFVQSRIAMNDVYVGLFIVAAYTLFAAVWTGWWRWRWAWLVGLPVVGVLLGLALASKWVGLYAIAGIGILILGRSALGRILLILGLIGGTVVLGNIALTALPAIHPTSGPNYIFVFVMVGLTLAAVLHGPPAGRLDGRRDAPGDRRPGRPGDPAVPRGGRRGCRHHALHVRLDQLQPLEIAGGPDRRLGRRLPAVPAGRLIRAWAAGAPARADRPAQPGRAGCPSAAGLAAPGLGLRDPDRLDGRDAAGPAAGRVCRVVPALGRPGQPADRHLAAGHTGQTLIDLTKSMYDYHNNLRATHPASSPFWAWPLDFKPVWFYQASFAGNTSAAIYDNGNLVTWWLEIPAIAFVAWQAFKRGSLALGLITIGFVLQWVPWMRIDRATFQYHYYTSLPFLVLALAYFLAELWHGASRHTWLLARVSAAWRSSARPCCGRSRGRCAPMSGSMPPTPARGPASTRRRATCWSRSRPPGWPS